MGLETCSKFSEQKVRRRTTAQISKMETIQVPKIKYEDSQFAEIPEAVVFQPTIEDMENFAKYIERLEPICEPLGGFCKVIPPPSCVFPSGVNRYKEMLANSEKVNFIHQ
jgi:hypothetical protein